MKTDKNKNVLIGALVLILILVLGMWYVTHRTSTEEMQIPTNSTATTTATTSATTPSVTKPVTSKTGTSKSGTGSTGTTAHPIVAPRIISFEPAAGTPGTSIAIKGTNFDSTTNYIYFGTPGGRHHPDGTPDNLIATVGSSNGTSVSFTVPTSGPSGLLCDAQNHCVAISSIRLAPGTYPVTVRTKAGTSNTAIFTVPNY
jgi:hypothetical protein